MAGFNITSYNTGTWDFKNVTINDISNFNMNSTGVWRFLGYPRFEMIEA